MSDLRITLQTKIGELLDAYPQLESVLIAQAPAFERLRNPVLRRTVARLATLETAASLGGVAPRQLLAVLRRAVGQPIDEDGDLAPETAPSKATPPDWLSSGKIAASLDAEILLARGQTPLREVLEQARALERGEILRLTASFRPLPLIEALEKQGYRTFLRAEQANAFELFVAKSG